ncbi:hypothetical protein V1505DRAFT_351984 [Lipomyces doorenjongii]
MLALEDDTAVDNVVGEREQNSSIDSSGHDESVSFNTSPMEFLKVMSVTGECTADYFKTTIDYWNAEFETHWDNITRIWEHYKRLVLPLQFEKYRDILGPGQNLMTQIEQIMLEFQNQHVDYDQIILARAYEKFVLGRDYIHLFTFFADLEHGSGMRLEKDLQMQQTLNLMSCIYRNWRRIEDNMEEEAYALAVQLADVKPYVDEESPVRWMEVIEEL